MALHCNGRLLVTAETHSVGFVEGSEEACNVRMVDSLDVRKWVELHKVLACYGS